MMQGENNPFFTAAKATYSRPSWAFLLLLFAAAATVTLHVTTRTISPFPDRAGLDSSGGPKSCSGLFRAPPPRKVVKSIADFGGVGDGTTSNTAAFRRAVEYLGGGAQLNVPRGRWVTGSFNLTSDFTLFLEDGAVILGSQVTA